MFLEGEFKPNKNHMPMSLIPFLFLILKRVLLSLLDNPTTTAPKPSWRIVKFRASTNIDTTEFLWELQHDLENICSINIHNLFTWQNIYQKEIKDKCRKDQEDEMQKLSVFYSKLMSCNSEALIFVGITNIILINLNLFMSKSWKKSNFLFFKENCSFVADVKRN